jgi:hypothetical protein
MFLREDVPHSSCGWAFRLVVSKLDARPGFSSQSETQEFKISRSQQEMEVHEFS